jgi:hypothetical protein
MAAVGLKLLQRLQLDLPDKAENGRLGISAKALEESIN